jgi:hypothetical protein
MALTAMRMKMAVFWDVARCRLVYTALRFVEIPASVIRVSLIPRALQVLKR